MHPETEAAGRDGSFEHLPGWDIVRRGLKDLATGQETIEGLLVALASDRLARLGLNVPGQALPDVPGRLYRLIALDVTDARAHARYNALRRRLASFLRASAHATSG